MRWKDLGITLALVLVSGCATLRGGNRPTGQALDDKCVPKDSMPHHRQASLKLVGPPPGFSSGLAWMQFVQELNNPAPSTVRIDWLEFGVTLSNGQDVVLDRDEFNNKKSDIHLYSRWYTTDENLPAPVEFDTTGTGALIIHPNLFPNNVWHMWNQFWTPDGPWRVTIPPGAVQGWARAQVQITGPAYAQLGIDYWRYPNAPYAGVEVNNHEAGNSDWACWKTPGWQILSLGKETLIQPQPDHTSDGVVSAPNYPNGFKSADGYIKRGAAVAFIKGNKTYISKEVVTQNKYGDPINENRADRKFYLLGGDREPWAPERSSQELEDAGDFLVYSPALEGRFQVGWKDPADPSADSHGVVWSPVGERFSTRPGTFCRDPDYLYLAVRE